MASQDLDIGTRDLKGSGTYKKQLSDRGVKSPRQVQDFGWSWKSKMESLDDDGCHVIGLAILGLDRPLPLTPALFCLDAVYLQLSSESVAS